MKTKRLVTLALLLALSIALHYLEGLIPFNLIPGFRLGLANIISLFALYYFGGISFVFINVARVLIVGMISTGFVSPSFLMSLFGMIISSVITLILYYFIKTSIYGTSIASSLFHVIGQLLAYSIYFDSFQIFYYIIYLGTFSLVSGFLIAFLCSILIKRLPKFYKLEENKRRN